MKKGWTKWVAAAFSIGCVVLGAYYKSLYKPASESLRQKIKTVVASHPELQPSYDRAMSDGRLTLAEAQTILDEAQALPRKVKAEVPPSVPEDVSND